MPAEAGIQSPTIPDLVAFWTPASLRWVAGLRAADRREEMGAGVTILTRQYRHLMAMGLMGEPTAPVIGRGGAVKKNS